MLLRDIKVLKKWRYNMVMDPNINKLILFNLTYRVNVNFDKLILKLTRKYKEPKIAETF